MQISLVKDSDVWIRSGNTVIRCKRAYFIFMTCNGGIKTLEQRLMGRNTETRLKIKQRLNTARKEIEFYQNNKDFFDFVCINDDFNQAFRQWKKQMVAWFPSIVSS